MGRILGAFGGHEKHTDEQGTHVAPFVDCPPDQRRRDALAVIGRSAGWFALGEQFLRLVADEFILVLRIGPQRGPLGLSPGGQLRDLTPRHRKPQSHRGNDRTKDSGACRAGQQRDGPFADKRCG